jgi:hypothetical protein
MRINKASGFFVAVAIGLCLVSLACSSSSDCADSGTCTSDGGTGGAASGNGGTGGGNGFFAITPGTYCFDIVSMADGANDGCGIEVAKQVGTAIPVNYDNMSGMLIVGNNGSLGTGTIGSNMGTLMSDKMPTDPMMATCSWHEVDSTVVTVTAENQFTVSVNEVESEFASVCSDIPTGGTCTSTWTWMMMIDGNKSPTNGCM